jgi:hypothetical protein
MAAFHFHVPHFQMTKKTSFWPFLVFGGILCILLTACPRPAAKPSPKPLVQSPSPTPPPAGPDLQDALFAVVYQGEILPGIAIRDGGLSGGSTPLIVANLPGAKIGEGVYIYARSTEKSPTVRRANGEIVGIDSRKSLAFIESSAAQTGLPIPRLDAPPNLPIQAIQTRVKWLPIPPKDQESARIAQEEQSRSGESFESFQAEKREFTDLKAKAQLRLRAAIADKTATAADDAASYLGQQDNDRYRQLERAFARLPSVQPPPLFAECSLSIEPAPPESPGLLAAGNGEYLAWRSVLPDGALATNSLSGLHVERAGLLDVGVSFDFSGNGVGVSTYGSGIAEYDWESIELLVNDDSKFSATQRTGGPIISAGERVLGRNQTDWRKDSQSRFVRREEISGFDRRARTADFQLSAYFPLSKKAGSQKFVAQFRINRRGRPPLDTPPFTFAIQSDPERSATLDPHPIAHWAAPLAGPNEPAHFASPPKVLRTNGRILDLTFAKSGQLLVVRQDAEPFVRFVDLPRADWVTPVAISAEKDSLVATSGNLLYVLRGNRILERWNLDSGKKEKAHISKTTDPVLSMAAAPSNPTAPLMLLTRNSVRFVDPETLELKKVDIRKPDARFDPEEKEFQFDHQREPMAFRAEASGDGLAYTASFEIEDRRTYEMEPLRTTRSYLFMPDADFLNVSVLPWDKVSLGASGRYRFSARGREDMRKYFFRDRFPADRQLEAISTDDPALDGPNLPVAVDPTSSTWVVWARNSRRFSIPEDYPALKLYSAVSGTSRISALATIRDAGELRGVPASPSAEGLLADQRIRFSLAEKKLVTVGAGDREIFIRDLDLDKVLAEKLAFISSMPPTSVARGKTLDYQIQIRGNTQADFRLQQAPVGATLSPSGRLNWPVPKNFLDPSAKFSVQLSSGGASRTYEFDVDVSGPPPVEVYLAEIPPDPRRSGAADALPRNALGSTLPISVSRIALSEPAIHSTLAGNRYLVCAIRDQPLVEVVDLATGKLVVSRRVREANPRMTGNADSLFLYSPKTRTLEKLRLPDLSVQRTQTLNQPVLTLVAGNQSALAPILLIEGEENSRRVSFIDPSTLGYLPLRMEDEQLFRLPASGCFYAGVDGGYLPSTGDLMIRLANGRALLAESQLPGLRDKAGDLARMANFTNVANTISSSGQFMLSLHQESIHEKSYLAVSSGRDPSHPIIIEPLKSVSEPKFGASNDDPHDPANKLYLLENPGRIALFCDNGRVVTVIPWAPNEWIPRLRAAALKGRSP